MTDLKISPTLIADYATQILNFEYSAGESFTDQFMDDEVLYTSFAFWLVGKGYIERGNHIVNQINLHNDRNWSDQELVFKIHQSPLKYFPETNEYFPVELDNLDDALSKDAYLWAEFLLSTDRYEKPFKEFLENFNAGNPY